jgi:hypothetical protein
MGKQILLLFLIFMLCLVGCDSPREKQDGGEFKNAFQTPLRRRTATQGLFLYADQL